MVEKPVSPWMDSVWSVWEIGTITDNINNKEQATFGEPEIRDGMIIEKIISDYSSIDLFFFKINKVFCWSKKTAY